MSLDQSIREYCKILSLPVVASCYQREAEASAKAKVSYQGYLLSSSSAAGSCAGG
jgi:hypothetical protein